LSVWGAACCAEPAGFGLPELLSSALQPAARAVTTSVEATATLVHRFI
jgi:hypothetical protein